MSIFESISSALLGIWGNKMRAVFTMFGIVVGISSVIMIISVGDGFRSSINEQFEEFGLDEIEIYNTSETRPVEWHERLRTNDAEFLREHNDILVASSVYSQTFLDSVEIIGSNDRRGLTLTGVDEYAYLLSGPDLVYGRHIFEQDVINASNVIIIDEVFSKEVFGVENGVGRELEIQTPFGSKTFTVIGIVEGQESNEFTSMFDLPLEAKVPITVVQNMYGVGDVVNQIIVRVADRDNIFTIGNNIIRLLEISNNTEDVYEMYSISSTINQVNSIISLFTMFLTLVAGISLLVGGIGVMNIMLVSVTERTKEIGIRKALGAANKNILLQFLLEASILTGIGGAVGVMFGYIGAVITSTVATILLDMLIVPTMSFTVVTFVVLISASLGIIFGVYPAAKAAKLDPVDSLRFE